MAICIDYEIKENVYDGEIEVKDFAVIGFKRTAENLVDLLYYLSDKDDVVYIVQNSFIIGDEDNKFLDNPINYFMDVDKLSGRDPETFNKIINDMATSGKSYISSFTVSKITDKPESATSKSGSIPKMITCKAIYMLEGEQHVMDFIIPLSIFVRIQIMKSRMIFNIPMNAYLDQDEKYNNLKFYRGCTVDYFGCDASNKDFIVALYVLKDAIGKKTGLAIPTPSSDEIVTTKTVEVEKFTKLFSNSYPINMTKIIMMDWLDENDKPCNRICVYIVNEDSISVYMTVGEPKNNILMKPHGMIFPEGV